MERKDQMTKNNKKYKTRIPVCKFRLAGELHRRGFTLLDFARVFEKSIETLKQWNRIGWPEKYYFLLVDAIALPREEAADRLLR